MSAWLDTYRPKVLCLGAGGQNGLEELGAMWFFEMNGNLDEVHSYIGSSVGGILITLKALGYSCRQILEHAVETTLFDDISELNFTQIIHEFGLVSNSTFTDGLAKRLTIMITAKMGKMPTLLELYNFTKKRVRLCIVSLKKDREFYADHLSDPDMDLLVALRSTSNSPLIFGKLEHQKDFLVDGALESPFPILAMDDGVTQILGIGVQNDREWNHKTLTGLGYYDRITSIPLRKLTEFSIANSSDACYSMIIPIKSGMSMLDSGGDPNARLTKFLHGYQYAEKHVKQNPPKSGPGTKINNQMPLSKPVVKASLDSHAAKVLLRCIREDPLMFEECMREAGIPNPFPKVEVKPVSHPPAVVARPREEVQQARSVSQIMLAAGFNEGATRPLSVDPDDVVELPRVRQPYRDPYASMFGIPRPLHIQFSISPEILDAIFEAMMGAARGISTASFKKLK